MPDPAPRFSVELALLAVLATLWGASYTFIRIGVATIPPVTLIAGRTFVAGAILLAVIRARAIAMPRDAATWRAFAIVLASACYGGAALFGRTFRTLDPLLPAAGSMICGAGVLVPLSLAVDRPWTLSPSAASSAALLVLSTASTALAFAIFFRLVRTLGAVATTAQACLRVPVGVAVGVVGLGETLSPTAWTGLGCVVAGVAAMSFPSGSRRRPAPHRP